MSVGEPAYFGFVSLRLVGTGTVDDKRCYWAARTWTVSCTRTSSNLDRIKPAGGLGVDRHGEGPAYAIGGIEDSKKETDGYDGFRSGGQVGVEGRDHAHLNPDGSIGKAIGANVKSHAYGFDTKDLHEEGDVVYIGPNPLCVAIAYGNLKT